MKSITILLCGLIPFNVFGQDLNSALKLASSEQYEEAEKVFEELVAKEPANGNVYYYYGETYLKDYLSDTFSNSLDEYATNAEKLFQKGIQQAPGNVLNLVGMGAVTLLRTSDTTKANSYFVQAEAAVPEKLKKKDYTPELAVILTKLAAAQLYGKVNRFKKAVNYLERAKIINPADPNIYLTLGDVYIRQNDASNALFNYNQALNKDPSSPLPKIKIGNIYMRVPNLQAASPYFEEARQIDSTFAPVYRSLGELWTLAGRHDQAKLNYYKFLQLSGNNTPAKVRYGNSLFRSKDYDGALTVIQEVLEVDKSRNYLNRLAAYSCYEKKPQDLEKGLVYIEEFLNNAKPENIIPRDYAYYGRILYKLAKSDSVMLDKAFEQLHKAYELDPADNTLLSEMALNYYYSRRYDQAIEMFNTKAAKGVSDKGDAMLIAKSYYQMKDSPKAEEVLNKIISEQPENMEARAYLARTFSQMDPTSELGLAAPKFEELIQAVGEDTVKFKPYLYEALTYMGYYTLLVKEYETAKAYYNRLYNLDPNNKDWQMRSLSALSMISYREKKYNESLEIYQRMLVFDPNNAAIKQNISDLKKVIAAQKNQ
jgi:tetratricopeptide (TPR) repeat protein